jgi:REP-associated tyrosine transposase
MLISIPPKYSVSEVIRGTQATEFSGPQILGEGVPLTIGRDEETIRAYIRNQELADKQLDQLQLKLAFS